MPQKKNPAQHAFVTRQAELSRRMSQRSPHATDTHLYSCPQRPPLAPPPPRRVDELDEVVAFALAYGKAAAA